MGRFLGNWQAQFDIALSAFEAFNFPPSAIPDAALKIIREETHCVPLYLSIITSEEGTVPYFQMSRTNLFTRIQDLSDWVFYSLTQADQL